VTPPVDVVFDLLASHERRNLCTSLIESPAAVVTVSELVDLMVDEETSAADREQLAVDLHHCHLPKLAEAGIVDYDPRSTTARYWGQPTVEKWAEHVAAVDEKGTARRS
jgi:hypothetical protein